MCAQNKAVMESMHIALSIADAVKTGLNVFRSRYFAQEDKLAPKSDKVFQ